MRAVRLVICTLSVCAMAGCPAPDLGSASQAGLTPGVYLGTLSCPFTCSGELVLSSNLDSSFELTKDSHIFIDGDEYRVGVVGVMGDGTQITITDIAANVHSILIQYQVDAGTGGSGTGSITVTWLTTSSVTMTRTETRFMPQTGEMCTLDCEGTLTR
jgi:hypothetical protein